MTPILIAIPADAMMCKDMLCIHTHIASPADANLLNGFIEWIRMILRLDWIRIDVCFAFTYTAIPADAYLLTGYVLNGYIVQGYVLVGYVLNGYLLKR